MLGPQSRRQFLGTAGIVAASATATGRIARAAGFTQASQRPRLGVVGCGSRWGWLLANGGPYGVGPAFAEYGDYVAVCDVDQRRRDAAAGLVEQWHGKRPLVVAKDYRELLDRDDLDAILVFTPDHWHAKVTVEAMRAGKDVYCEKPLTLTIAEGQLIGRVVKETERIVQVGTQQRSDQRFLDAVALVRAGRIGAVRRVECGLGGAPVSPAIPITEPPAGLDWDMWLGPAAEAPYRSLPGAENETHAWSNNHYEFRWWYDYSGGKLTDWGAHHIDIATWAMDKTTTGPAEVIPELIEHPVPFEDGRPTVSDRYQTATGFRFRARYADNVELIISHDARNGVLFEGSEGRLFVNRGSIEGRPAEELATRPLPDGLLAELYGSDTLPDATDRLDSGSHVRNFFESLRTRRRPVSDVESHHRALTTCHLANIAGRLARTVRWDPQAEQILDDPEAQAFTARTARSGYEIRG